MKPENIVLRQRKLESERKTVDDVRNEITRYIAPYRGEFFKDDRSENSVSWRMPWLYDSTAVMASQSLSANLHSRLTSPTMRWFGLRFRNDELNLNNDAASWADEAASRIFNALQDSNFNVEAAEAYQDLVDFGEAVVFEEEDKKPDDDEWYGVDFTAVPIKECFFEQDAKGQIYNFYRKMERTPIQLLDKFGDSCPEWVRELAEDPATQPDHKETVIFCIWTRAGIDKRKLDLTKPLDVDKRPCGYQYVLQKDATPLTSVGGYYEMPVFIPRWRTTSSSKHGNSPSMIALPDVLSLNRLIEFVIQAAEKVIDPPTLTTERGLMSDLDLNPAGLTVVRDIDEIRPYVSGARFDVSYQEIQRFRDQIREYYMLDQLMLPPMEGTPATATEISARMAQLEKVIAPTLGRLIKDFLDPLISRTFNIMMRNGQLPEMPAVLLENANTDFDVEYVGALARSLQQDMVDGVDRWIMQIGNAAQLNPEVLDIPDWDELFRGTGRALGVPAKYMKGRNDIKTEREQRKQEQSQMIEGQTMEQLGKGMQAMGEGEAALSNAIPAGAPVVGDSA